MNSPTVSEHEAPAFVAMPPDLMVRLEGVAVRYRAPEERLNTFKEYAIRRLQRRIHYKDFYALDGINLDVHRGEIFGIIGRNGAGKSTLLKVVSRVLIPTRGRVWLRGQVSPLLELGAGFHPELTGRENVMLNGTLLGHSSRELEERMDSIIDFAELGSFIEAPLRTYSSGMAARLGFAVATAWRPEILLVDEVLGVGDEAFREKCQRRMRTFREDGSTILMVAHDMATVAALCPRAAWLQHGKIGLIGPAEEVIKAYRAG
jgi:ABC-type polysaccharide/polyol phosphate transport system ATPase subunit